MASINITTFAGENPRVAPEHLPTNFAQRAENCRLTSGNLEPWAAPSSNHTTFGKIAAGKTVEAIHKVGDSWLHWVRANDASTEMAEKELVKIFRSPVIADTNKRLYINRNGFLWVMKQEEALTNGSNPNILPNPAKEYRLGVLKPATACTVENDSGDYEPADHEFAVIYRYVNTEDQNDLKYSSIGTSTSANGLVQVSVAGSPQDASWTVDFTDQPGAEVSITDGNGNRSTYRVDGRYLLRKVSGQWKKVRDAAFQISDSQATVNMMANLSGAEFNLPTPLSFGSAPNVGPRVTPVAAPSEIRSRPYIFTYVNTFGEESAPAPAQTEIPEGYEPSTDYPWTITFPAVPSVGSRVPYSKRYLYRLVTGNTSNTYQFVDEILIDDETPYKDETPDSLLGEVILTQETWKEPPEDITGFAYLGNGVFAALSGQTLYFSEPYFPHHFPEEYERSIGVDGVGLEAIGNSLVVLTAGDPVVLTGTDPRYMSDAKLDINQPCVAPRSVVNNGAAAGFISPVGYVYAGLGGSNIITKPLFAKSDWADTSPQASAFAARYDDGVVWHNSSEHQYLLTPSEPLAILTSLNLGANVSVLYSDPDDGGLYFVRGGELLRWDDGTGRLAYFWRSKVFSLRNPLNFGCGRIVSDAVPNGTDGTTHVDVPGGLGINESGINGGATPYTTTAPVLKLYFWVFDKAATGGEAISLIQFNTGTGNVPAAGSVISSGTGTGKVLSVHSALNATATAAGQAMPTSGYIRVKNSSGTFAAGALSGIGASVVASSRVGLPGFDMKHTIYVGDREPFRMPAGFRYDKCYFELEGTAVVEAVQFAESITELKELGDE